MIALEEDQIELALLVIIEDTLQESRAVMRKAENLADIHYHKSSYRKEANEASKAHWDNIMGLYEVLQCKSMQSHIDEATFPLIYRYMIQLRRSKAL